MLKKDEALARVNAEIRKIANKSGSKLLRNLPPMFYNEDIPGSPFNGDVLYHAWFNIDEREVVKNPDDVKLQALVRCRIENAIYSIIALLEDELNLLRHEL